MFTEPFPVDVASYHPELRPYDRVSHCSTPGCLMQDQIQKLYYSISEVGEMVDLEPHVLRYWQDQFDELHPRKNRAGRRVYTDDDVAVIRRIKYLLREDKYTIDGARQVLTREREGSGETPGREELIKLRAFLVSLLQRL